MFWMKDNRILIASGNSWKISMYQDILGQNDFPLEVYTLSDFEDLWKPVEDWNTVQENALKKAKYYAEKTGLPTVWDDWGFQIAALGNQPWVKARRWGGELPEDISDEDWLFYYLEKVKDIPGDLLDASLPFSRCLYVPWGQYFFQSEDVKIFVSKHPRRPYIEWLPLSAVCVFRNWQHRMDVSEDDPLVKEDRREEGFIEMLNKFYDD